MGNSSPSIKYLKEIISNYKLALYFRFMFTENQLLKAHLIL